MVKISRYRNYFPNLDQDIRSDIYDRMRTLIAEEKASVTSATMSIWHRSCSANVF